MEKEGSATFVQQLVRYVGSKDRVSIKELGQNFDLDDEQLLSILNPLIKEKIVGVEYKFAQPHFYLNADDDPQFQNKLAAILYGKNVETGEKYSDDEREANKHLIERFKGHVASRELQNAADSYKEILEAFDRTKDVKRIHELMAVAQHIEELDGHLLEAFDVRPMEKRIREILQRCREYLRIKKVHEAKQHYEEAYALFNSIPDDFVEKKTKLSNELLDLYKQVNDHYSKLLYWRLVEVSTHIDELLKTGKAYLEHNDFRGAYDIFSRCVEVLEQLPETFLKKRFAIYNELFDFYKQTSIKSGAKGKKQS